VDFVFGQNTNLAWLLPFCGKIDGSLVFVVMVFSSFGSLCGGRNAQKIYGMTTNQQILVCLVKNITFVTL